MDLFGLLVQGKSICRWQSLEGKGAPNISLKSFRHGTQLQPKTKFFLSVTLRPPIWQFPFWISISLELRDPRMNSGPFRNAPFKEGRHPMGKSSIVRMRQRSREGDIQRHRRPRNLSRGTKRDKLSGTNGVKFTVSRRFSLIFADFRFFLGIIAFGRRRFSLKTAGNRRFSQKTADFCRSRFVPFSLSLLIPPYLGASIFGGPTWHSWPFSCWWLF